MYNIDNFAVISTDKIHNNIIIKRNGGVKNHVQTIL